jgi:hypothetical protein
MRINIEYEASWQNSFLTGDNNKPLDKNNERKFKATSKSNIIDKRDITLNTILGLLCRLIGDQRKLYEAKQAEDYYFKTMEDFIKFEHKKRLEYNETAFIVNKSESRPPQSSFIGVLPDSTPLFFSEYSFNLWRVLDMNFDSLLDFILLPQDFQPALGHASPRHILSRLDSISSMEPYLTIPTRFKRLNQTLLNEEEKIAAKKKLGKNPTTKEVEKLVRLQSEIDDLGTLEAKSLDEKVLRSVDILNRRFSEKNYISEGKIYPMSLYAAGLYLMLDDLTKNSVPTNIFLNKNQNIQGFNPSGFNGVRDFLNPLAGGKKRCGGTPTELTKASGTLEITLDISKEKAIELSQLIEDAGVSAFYLGKKGLAYVSSIKV